MRDLYCCIFPPTTPLVNTHILSNSAPLQKPATLVYYTHMPITKTAKKALRQNAKRFVSNLREKREAKSLIKKFEKAVSAKKAEEARALLPQVQKALDKNARRGIIKKNTASRKKSRLAVRLAKPGL